MYDPELGRFMSADPFVQAPYNSQSYNRYSYVFNNPLSFTDPTGYTTEATKYDVEELPVTCDSACMEQHRKKLEAQQNAINQSNIAYWSASENRGEQWSYMNGAAYNIANFWGKVAFDLAAGGDGKSVNNGSYFSYDNLSSQHHVMTINPWDGDVWATAYTNEQHLRAMVSGIASVVPVGRAVLSIKTAWATNVSKFFYNPQSFGAISRAYWKQKGGANGASLHHWLFPQKAKFIPQGIRNAGFNLVELPALKGVFHPKLGLNQWMGFAQSWGGSRAIRASAVENMIRVGIPGSVAGSAYLGYQIGQD